MTKSNYPDLLIIGSQGSGKGTQAALLAEKYGYAFISSGDAAREIAKSDTELGQKIKDIIEAGNLIDTPTISEVIREKISQVFQDQPVILDGFPRTVEQYKLLKLFWPKLGRRDFKVIFLELSPEETLRRLSNRYVCVKCGTIYIGPQSAPCQKCGGRIEQREDDQPEAIKKRLELFRTETWPLVEELLREGRVFRINGAQKIEAVFTDIQRELNFK